MEKISPNLLSWASELEADAKSQAERTSRLPFVAGHVALMADAHYGLGSTVGSVIPTEGAIIPAAIGVDIGCGMIAANTGLLASDLPETLGPLMPLVEARVPAGVGRGHRGHRHLSSCLLEAQSFQEMPDKLRVTAANQMGSLGSGNHFLEISLDEEDRVWVVLHSGSRGVGNQLAKRHIETAKGLMKRYLIALEDPDLAYLAQGTPEFDAYIADMHWSQDYAYENRQTMMDATLASLAEVVGREIVPVEVVNCHHNFTQLEHHHGRELWITRKGAISARSGQLGVIPGSMGTSSFIVRGLGSPASYCSSSHGAGRRMSRGAARRALSTASLTAAMSGKVWNEDKADVLLDEHPDAYKDIVEVMENQRDLTEVVHTLRQIFNYKGT